ncbi:hypothetical protein GCK32_005723 [Trichostrongylus colubriformis]|uniref:Uncharacterized protein n=1 Tax=Trichostrongylus colubriformis TaxID=6319 RepID=A0AAN8GBS6_TRICO
MVFKFRERISNHRASLRKQFTRSLHVFDASGSLPKPDSPSELSSGNVVVFEPTTPSPDRDEPDETPAPEELNQAFIMMSGEPDPRIEP